MLTCLYLHVYVCAVQSLTSNRAYNTSPSLYGGDVVVDKEMEEYWKKGGNKKKRKLNTSTSSSKIGGTKSKKLSVSSSPSSSPSPSPTLEVLQEEYIPAEPIIGTCQILEKEYLRLTGKCDPARIRPQPVLMRMMEKLKQEWKEKADYEYCCSQLKVSIPSDRETCFDSIEAEK